MRNKLGALVLLLGAVGCGRGQFEDPEEIGHAAADALASLDETSVGASFASRSPLHRPELRERNYFEEATEWLLPTAHAAACWTSTFSTCSAGVRTRTYGDCALGGFKLSGDIKLTFSDATCSMAAAPNSVTREANFTLTGRRNATLTVSAPNGGQKVTRTADGFNYTVLGMQRVLADGAGKTLFDVSTRTLEDLVVKGTKRSERVISAGKLEVKHNLANYTTTLSPENLTWNGTCNCPVSGKLTGTVTNAKGVSATAVVEMTGCGTGTVTFGAEETEVNFDRCTGL